MGLEVEAGPEVRIELAVHSALNYTFCVANILVMSPEVRSQIYGWVATFILAYFVGKADLATELIYPGPTAALIFSTIVCGIWTDYSWVKGIIIGSSIPFAQLMAILFNLPIDYTPNFWLNLPAIVVGLFGSLIGWIVRSRLRGVFWD